MAISVSGIGSNLDIDSIVSQLVQVEAQPLTALARREASFQAKLSAYGTINSALSSFQSALQNLTDTTKILSLKATSSDTTVASVTASTNASAGTYALDITQVAASQRLVAAGQSSTSAAIGGGASTTLTFDFGTISGGTLTAYNAQAGTGGTYSGATFTSNGNGTKTVTIDSTNNSLLGIRDAINKADIGVTASIVNDGGNSPYRLVLSSDNAGDENSLKISVSGDAAISSLLSHDPAAAQSLQETVAGQDTELTLNGVFIRSAGTTLSDVIDGVAVTALKVGATNITVARDTSSATNLVNAFVKAYNDFNTTVKNLTAFDAETKTAAVLQGDSAVRSIQTQIRGLLGQALPNSDFSNLSQIGLTFALDGSLTLDSSKLQSALQSNAEGVAAVFAATGRATDSLVSHMSSTAKTQPGSYALNITQLATQGALTGSASANLTITSGVNDTLSFTVDGTTSTITLTAQTYASAAALAKEVQSKINGNTDFSGSDIAVDVTESGGVLTVTSQRYGSASNVSVTGNGADGLLGAGRVASVGLDVAGTIGGVAAVGSGQTLTAASGTGAEGLKVLISGGSTGNRGSVTFTQGYADRLDKLLDQMLGSNGILSSRTDGINQSIESIEDRREVLNRRLVDIEARLRKQFTALDVLISGLSQTSTFLEQQLANLPSTSSS